MECKAEERCSGPPSARAASAKYVPRRKKSAQKPEKYSQSLLYKLRHNNRAKDHWLSNEAFKTGNGTRKLRTRNMIEGKNAFISMLKSDSNLRACHQSTEYHVSV